jgi:hypothetical protein
MVIIIGKARFFFHRSSTIGERPQKLRLRRRKLLLFAFSRVGDSFCEVTVIFFNYPFTNAYFVKMTELWKKNLFSGMMIGLIVLRQSFIERFSSLCNNRLSGVISAIA